MARVDVLWEDDDGTPRVAPGTLEDKSAGGVSVRMRMPIKVGAILTIKWGSEQFSGTITNCRPDRQEYVVGVQRDPTSGSKQM
jgi:PilZ domain